MGKALGTGSVCPRGTVKCSPSLGVLSSTRAVGLTLPSQVKAASPDFPPHGCSGAFQKHPLFSHLLILPHPWNHTGLRGHQSFTTPQHNSHPFLWGVPGSGAGWLCPHLPRPCQALLLPGEYRVTERGRGGEGDLEKKWDM